CGDLVPAPDGDLSVTVQVLGPEWTRAAHVTLFANGDPIREAEIQPQNPEPAGLKWQTTWTLPRSSHDLWLVAVATGPGIKQPYWPTAKPYQPTSISSRTWVIGSTGVVRIDADHSGHFDSARDYAMRVVEAAQGDLPTAI